MTIIRDSVAVEAGGLTRTEDGYLVGIGKIARAGNVQQYYGRELGLTGDDAGKVFGVYRDPDVVFNKDSMITLAGRPVTINHPGEPVTADNHKELAVGHVGSTVAREGEHLTAPMAITDAAAVQLAEQGNTALSASYLVHTERHEDTAPDGTPYQFRQTGRMRFNHVALLHGKKPRAGNTRFGDSQADGGKDRASWGASPLTQADMEDHPMTLRTIVVDGLSVETTDAGAQAIEKLQADAAKSKAEMQAEHDALAKDKAELQGKMDALKADMDKMKDSLPDAAALDALADARAEVKATAKRILGDSATLDGKSTGDIKQEIVIKALGDAATTALAAMTDDAAKAAYIDGAYALAVNGSDAAPSDPVRTALKDAKPTHDAATAWADFLPAEGA